jgi:uncharacterized RDD family membrane protein YckC
MSEEIPALESAPIPAVPEKTLYLGKWSTRFVAWLIDVVMIIFFWNIIIGIFDQIWKLPLLWDYLHWELPAIGFEMLLIFAYWTVMEGFRGQSIGKMVMNLKVVNRNGTKITYTTAAIESLPKAFLNFPFIIILILDCLIGWLGMPTTKLRVFNRISNTIVIKTDYREPAGILYIKEKE